MNYIYVNENELVGGGSARNITQGFLNIEVSDEIFNDYLLNPIKYIYDGNTIVVNPNYEQELAQQEKERISHLTCTKRVLALCLQEYGITYTQLKELIATNEQAQLEWDLCVELERNNPLLDVMGAELNITPEQIDKIFLYANGEIDLTELSGK